MITSHFFLPKISLITRILRISRFYLKKNDEHFPNAKLANVWKVKEFGTPLLLLHLTKTLFLKAARTQARTLRLHYLFVVLIYLTLSRFQ